MDAFSFIKKYADHPKYLSPVGAKLNTKSWQTEAPLRMFLNNLNAEIDFTNEKIGKLHDSASLITLGDPSCLETKINKLAAL